MVGHPVFNGITIVGLGPGDPDQVTRQVWDWLNKSSEVYLRTRLHPTVAFLPPSLEIHSFDEVYEESDSFEDVYQKIVRKVLELGSRPEGVTYAVPGSPYIAESTSPEIIRQAKETGIQVRVWEGLSFLEPTFTALGLDPFPHLALLDAIELGQTYHPMFPPDMPALIAQIYSRQVAADVKLTLMNVYPDEYPVRLVHAAGTEQQVIEDLALYEIDRSPHIGLLTSLFLPPMAKETSFESFQELVAHLRAPEGCPWDREQTHLSLRNTMLEEAYEVLTALDTEDPGDLQEELGDLLLQIVLHAQIAQEEGEFGMADVLQGIHTKIVRRHPHVFGDVKLDSSDRVVRNWEKHKVEERQARGVSGEKGVLDGIPKALPALAQAQSYQARAARVGFDWADIEPVIDKVREELQEVFTAVDEESRADELGDLLFAVVNLVRWYGVEAESALRQTNQRFFRRFAHVEKRTRQNGKSISDMTLKEMDVYWEEAKHLEKHVDNQQGD